MISAFGVEHITKSFFPRFGAYSGADKGKGTATMANVLRHQDGKVGDWRPVTEVPKQVRTKRLNHLRAKKFVRESGGPDQFVFGRGKKTKKLVAARIPKGSAKHADGLSDALRGKVQRDLYFKTNYEAKGKQASRSVDIVRREDVRSAIESHELGQARMTSRRAVNQGRTFQNTETQSVVKPPRRKNKDAK